MNEILKLLGVEVLDESQVVEIKNKLSDIIDVKVRERMVPLLDEAKEELIREYENKFEDYKRDITEKFSDFVDSVLNEELSIPPKVLKYAKIGETYHDLIEQFKIKLAIDEGVLNEEVKELLREARDEIISLRESLNEAIKSKIDVESDARKMAAHIYLRQKCDGLTESQKNYILNLLGDVIDKNEIDRKFSYALRMSEDTENEDVTGKSVFHCICPECNVASISDTECNTISCSKCGAKLVDIKDNVTPASEAGQGVINVDDVDGEEISSVKNESTVTGSLFEHNIERWKKILRENKF